jgi:hypothetical protein
LYTTVACGYCSVQFFRSADFGLLSIFDEVRGDGQGPDKRVLSESLDPGLPGLVIDESLGVV